ncbi:hypothetical protein [Amycolatopsis anabasis]|uniref:hypothetical protein n=1 Tax=Amycolatopsis anabasis TaxID=1840409 RepID=UPI00131D6A92|nr:hypothetical protein [Amycolatopsis anabasis]
MTDQQVTSTLSGTNHGQVVQASTIHGPIYFSPQKPKLVPRQLPLYGEFANRVDDLARIADLAQRRGGRARVVNLFADRGMGTTALAITWLLDRQDEFADGQLYLDLNATAATDALGMALRALGIPPEQVPQEAAERVLLYRSVTAGKRLAVLAEAGLSGTQVLPLVPASPEALTLVTSRRPLPELIATGGRRIEIPALTRRGVDQMLAAYLGHDYANGDPAVADLVTAYTGGRPGSIMPLIISASVGDGSLPKLLNRLGTPHHDGASITETAMTYTLEALNTVHATFTRPQCYLYRALGVTAPDAEFDKTLLLSLLSGLLTAEFAGELLDNFVRDKLVLETGEDTYRLDPTVHEHAYRQAKTEPVSASLRWSQVQWFVETARKAAASVMPRRSALEWHPPAGATGFSLPARLDDRDTALDWLDARRAALLPVLEMAMQAGHFREVTRIEHAWAVAVIQLGDHGLGAQLSELAVQAARKCHDPAAEISALHRQARSEAYLGNADTARALAEQADHWAKAHCDDRAAAKAHRTFGILAALVGDHEHAAYRFALAATGYDRLHRHRSRAIALMATGEQLLKLPGRENEAEAALKTAQTLFTRDTEPDAHNLACTRLRLGELELARGNVATARALADLADTGLAARAAERAKLQDLRDRCERRDADNE